MGFEPWSLEARILRKEYSSTELAGPRPVHDIILHSLTELQCFTILVFIVQLVFFSDPTSLDFFCSEVFWLLRPNTAQCFSLNTMNIMPIDQQLKWLFITTYKDPPIAGYSTC